MQDLYRALLRTWDYVAANWKWPVAIGVISAFIGYRSYRLNRANQLLNFRKQLNDAHATRRSAEALWPQSDCKDKFREAVRDYNVVLKSAHGRRQLAEAELYVAVCTNRIANLATGEDQVRLRDEYERLVRPRGGRARGTFVRTAIEEAHDYLDRFAGDSGKDLFLELADLLHELAMQSEPNSKRKIAIAYDHGRRCNEIGEYSRAQAEFDFCKRHGAEPDGLYYQEAVAREGQGHFEDALASVQKHLRTRASDPDAKELRRGLEDSIRKKAAPTAQPRKSKLPERGSHKRSRRATAYSSYEPERKAMGARLEALIREYFEANNQLAKTSRSPERSKLRAKVKTLETEMGAVINDVEL
jgi:hypothetical protein